MASYRERVKGSGKWEITIHEGYDNHGKRKRSTKTVYISPTITEKKREKILQNEIEKFEKEVKEGFYQQKLKFSEFGETFIKDHAEKQLSPVTVLRYKSLLNRVNKSIGHIVIQELKPFHLIKLYDELKDEGYAPKSILHHHRLISTILQTGVYWGVLKENICKRVKPPKLEYKEKKYLNEKEAKRFLELLGKEPIMWKTLLLLALTSGCRRGELAGLCWKDIDFENAEINIIRTSQYIPKKGIIDKEPKTKSSIRTVDLPSITVNALKEYRVWYLEKRLQVGKDWVDTDKVFCQWNGTTIHPDSISDFFHKFRVKNGFEERFDLALIETYLWFIINS